ncbi:MAG: hypothetical protein ACK2TS_06575 [Anaerolineales bacterium]
MSKYSKYQKPEEFQERKIHPIWRGIGCILALVLPVISYFLAVELVDFGLANEWPIPRELLGNVHIPGQVWVVNLPSNIISPINRFPNLLAVILFTFVILILLTGLISWIYSLLYRVIGPPQLSPIDAAPIKTKKVRKSR